MKGLTVFFANLRGLHRGTGDLCVAIQDCHPDFVGLVETHLDGESLGIYLPSGYAVAAQGDCSRLCGGLLLLFICW